MLSIAKGQVLRGVVRTLQLTFQLACLIGFGSAACAQARVQEADVCEIEKNPPAFSNKLIVISGSLYAGPHGMYLYGKNCADQPGARRGPICVARSTFSYVPKVQFQTKSEALIAIGEAARSIREQNVKFEDAIRVRGILFVAQGDTGFCHLGKSSTVIVVDQVMEYTLTFPD